VIATVMFGVFLANGSSGVQSTMLNCETRRTPKFLLVSKLSMNLDDSAVQAMILPPSLTCEGAIRASSVA
jgi:hypothetical protein